MAALSAIYLKLIYTQKSLMSNNIYMYVLKDFFILGWISLLIFGRCLSTPVALHDDSTVRTTSLAC